MEIAPVSSRSMLRCGTALTAVVALIADLAFAEHPTHVVVLGVVAVVVWAVHRLLTPSALLALPAVSGALVSQPTLHLTSTIGRPVPTPHDHADLLHILVSDAPAASMQVVVPAVVLVALASVGHLLQLLIGAVRRPLAVVPTPTPTQTPVLVPVRAQRLGSMLRWCGWSLRAARRGPPPAYRHVFP